MNKKLLSIIALILVMCFVLVGCGEPVMPDPKPHEHTFESGNTWEKNAQGHWHKALCEHKELIADFDDHNDANDDGVCDDCGYSDPTHTHTYEEDWQFDAKKHWNESDCQHSGVIGNEAPHTPDALGICTVCGYVVSDPDIDSVEDAVQVGISQKDSVEAGTVASASGDSSNYSVDSTDYYEFRENYVYIARQTAWFNAEYYYTMSDTGVIGVQIFSDGSIERYTATDANLWGPEISTNFVGYLDDGYFYGTEHLIEYLYSMGKDDNFNADFTESVENGVYTFSFGYYSYGTLSVITVQFTLDAEEYIFNNVSVVSQKYYEESIEVVTEATDDAPATYKVKEGASADYVYAVAIEQYTSIPNPIDPDKVIMKEFVLVDGNGDLVEDTITIVRGEYMTLTFDAIRPTTYLPQLNEILFESEVIVGGDEYLAADYYIGNDYFTLRSVAPAGTTFELVMTANGVVYNYTVEVIAADPTEMTVGTLTDSYGNFYMNETNSVTITEGDMAYVAAVTDTMCDILVSISPEVEGIVFESFYVIDDMTYDPVNNYGIDLSQLPVGEYVISFTTVENSALVGEVAVTVEEKPEEEEFTLSGTYKLVDFYDHTKVSPFIYIIDEATQTVVYINGTTEKTFSYYIENDTLFFMDGTTPQLQYAYSISLDENGVPFEAYCSGNVVRYAPIKEESAPSIEGAGTSDDPYIITEEGDYVAHSVEGGYVYFTYVATEDVTFNLEFTGDDYFLEYGTFNFNLCTMNTAKTFTIDLTAGQTLYLKVSTFGAETADVPFTVSLGSNGGNDSPTIVDEGYFVVVDSGTGFELDGTYNYVLYSDDSVVITFDGEETSVIILEKSDEGYWTVSSAYPGLMMAINAPAPLFDADIAPITELDGVANVMQMPSRYVYLTFYFNCQPEGGDDNVGGDDGSEVEGSGTVSDPYVVTLGNYTILATYNGTYVTFTATEDCTISFTVNGNADMLPEDFSYPLAFGWGTYTQSFAAGESFTFILCTFEDVEVELVIEVGESSEPENTELLDSISGAYEFEEFDFFIEMSWDGSYTMSASDKDYNFFDYYSFNLVENIDGTVTITVTPNANDTFGLANKEIVFVPNEYIGYVLTIDGEQNICNPVMDSFISNFPSFNVDDKTADITETYYEDFEGYSIFVHNSDYDGDVTRYYLLNIVENTDATLTITVVGILGFDAKDNIIERDDAYGLANMVFTATFADGVWSMTMVEKEPEGPSQEDIVNDAYDLPKDATMENVTLTGVITKIDTAYNSQYKNISVVIVVTDADKPILCYRLTVSDKSDAELLAMLQGLAVGDEITVTGTIKNYSGTIEFDSNTVLNSVNKTPTLTDDQKAALAREEINAPVSSIKTAGTTTLPATATNGVAITWSVSANDYATVTADGLVVSAIPAQNTTIVLTATYTSNGVTITESFNVTLEAATTATLAATISFANTSNRVSQDSNSQVWEDNGITVTNNKGSGSNIIDSSNPVRFYKNSIVTVEYENMTKIVVECNTADYATALVNSITNGANVTVSGKVVTIVLAEATNSFTVTLSGGQVRVNKIDVYVG